MASLDQEVRVFRVCLADSDWTVFENPRDMDEGRLSSLVESYSATNPDLADLQIPAPGGFSKADWSYVPHYTTRTIEDALVQRFARLASTLRGFQPSVSASFVERHHIHSTTARLHIVTYADLASGHPDLPLPYIPGTYVADEIWPLPRPANAVSYASSHGLPHEVLVIAPDVELFDVQVEPLSVPNAAGVLGMLKISIR